MTVTEAPMEVSSAAETGRTTMNREDRQKVREFAAEKQITRHDAFVALNMPGENPYSAAGQHPTGPNSAVKSKKTPKAAAKKRTSTRTRSRANGSTRPEAASRASLQAALSGRLRELDTERAQIVGALMDRLAGDTVHIEPGQTLMVESREPVEVIVPKKAKYRILTEHV